jgi:hypothetical protein
MVLNSSENIANRVAHFLNGETRLDYRLSQKTFLFGLSSLRVDTRSDNRLFLGSGVGTNLSHDLSLDVGIGLTRLFGTGQDQRLIEGESLLGKRLLSALSTIHTRGLFHETYQSTLMVGDTGIFSSKLSAVFSI